MNNIRDNADVNWRWDMAQCQWVFVGGKKAVAEAKKDDADKEMFQAVPTNAMFELAKVMTLGAKKYSLYNYLEGEGLSFSRLFGAMQRHSWKWWRGLNTNDEDGGVHHLAHVAASALMALELILVGKGIDDRPPKAKDVK